MDKKNS